MTLVRLLTVALCCGLAACARGAPTASPSASASPAADAARGAAIFSAQCAVCHGAGGRAGAVGPSLLGERRRMKLAAALAWIEDPMPPMPKLYPSPLSAHDVRDVAAYVESL